MQDFNGSKVEKCEDIGYNISSSSPSFMSFMPIFLFLTMTNANPKSFSHC